MKYTNTVATIKKFKIILCYFYEYLHKVSKKEKTFLKIGTGMNLREILAT